ncbi:MAG: leucine-rich repeat protein [Clostridia bacterium]|nr:leucine-rich repeat protein [Clostridia bacterium]
MKKILSLFLAIIMIFGVAAVGITALPHSHAEAAQSKFIEDNFYYTVSDGKATVVGYADKLSTDEIFIPEVLGGYPVTKLAAESFKGCRCIAITIPASVTVISPEAFAYDMPNIERYTVLEDNPNYFSDEDGVIYSDLSYMGYPYLFAYPKNAPAETYTANASNLLTFIGAFAFSEAANLKSVEVWGPVYNAIDNYAFYNAKKLERVSGTHMQIIGDYAFSGCSSLSDVSITLGGPVQWLGWEPFEGTAFVNNLENYDEDGVLYLGNNLITTLPEADKVYYEIKAGTKAVAGGAFKWESLKEVYIPSSVNWIYSNPFARCANLENFSVDSSSSLRVDEYGVLRDNEMIIAYPNGVYQTCYVVDEGLAQICSYAFYNSPIKNFYIPATGDMSMAYLALGGDGVTDIHFGGSEGQWEAIRHQKEDYEKMTAAESVAKIHYNDFSAVTHNATINNGKYTSCTCGYTAEYSPANGEFLENGFVYNVVDGNAVIESYEYKDSTAALVIPDTLGGYPVTEIGSGAFKDCMFSSAHIPASVTAIHCEAFAYALNNQSFTVAEENENYHAKNGVLCDNMYGIVSYPQNAPATSYKVPNNIIAIMPYAFCGTKNLKTVTMPQYKLGTANYFAVQLIGDCAFLNSSVETVDIRSENFMWMGNAAFENSQLKEISFVFDKDDYGYDINLEIDALGFTFGHDVFEGTPFLENAEYDEDGVFYHGNMLIATKEEAGKKNYDIKDGTTAVAGGAFRWSGLENVNIPASVECIGGSAFSRATSLKRINASANSNDFSTDNSGVLYNKDETKLIAYPVGNASICYGIPRGVTEIGEFAFNNVQKLECVNVPSDVTDIGAFAFGMGGFECITNIRYEGSREDWEAITVNGSDSGWISYTNSIVKVCNTYTEGVHVLATHNVNEPSCNWYGYDEYICSCGFKYKSLIPATGHIPEEEYRIIDPAECESSGRAELYCSACGTALERKKVPALGHDKVFVEYLEPTCELVGGTLYKCNRCEKDVFEEEAPALGHDKVFVEYIAPTCEEAGGTLYKCGRCEAEIFEEDKNAPAIGHVESDKKIIVEPTCTEDGGLFYACGNCDEPIEIIEYYKATGHTEGERKILQEGTCTQPQVEIIFCADCKKELGRVEGEIGGHNYKGTIINQDCTTVMWYYRCSSCGDYYYHEEKGSTVGHVTETVTVEPTCTEEGKRYNKCTVCGDTVGYITVLDPIGHSFSETVTKEATCTEEGILTKTCTVCGTVEEEAIPEVSHTFGKWEYESGNTFSGKCSVCGDTFDSIEVDISLNPGKIRIYNKTSKKLTVTVTENITDDIEFVSSDETVAAVDENGKVTAKAPGTAVITARIRSTDISAECEVIILARSFGIEWIVDGETLDYSFVEEGSVIEAPEAPEKSGYVFAGWSPEIPEVMPSEGLTFTAVYNIFSQAEGYDVSATYSIDAFDEPISLDVKEVEGEREPGGVYMVDGKNYNQVGLYNIKAVNEAETVVQPNEGHRVTIRLALPEAYANRTSFVVYHRFVDGTREQLSTANGTLRVENGYLVFEVSSFSEFEVLAVTPLIKITALPAKTVYACGEKIDLSGIRIVFVNSDGTEKEVTDTEYLTVSGFDSSEPGSKTVKVNYGQYSDTFRVKVRYTFWQWLIKILTFGLFGF